MSLSNCTLPLGYPHHDADSIFRPLSHATLFRIYGIMYFYLNACRVIISLYGTACSGQRINHFRFARIFFAVLQTRSLLLYTVCCASVIHSEYNEVTRQNEPHKYSIQFITHRRQIMRRYVVAAPLREKVKVNLSLSTPRRHSKCTAPLILNHGNRW